MKEVSAKVLDVFLKGAPKKGAQPAELLKGTTLALADLQRRDARLGWSDFRIVMKNVGEVWTADELIQLGRDVLRTPLLVRSVTSAARLLFTATDFYEWITVKGMGAGNQQFRCIDARFTRLVNDKVRIELRLADGYEPSPEFFRVSQGTFIEIPSLLGMTPAAVDMVIEGRSAIYDINVPPGGGWAGKVRRALLYPFSARQVALGLKDANESLEQRLHELSAAQAETLRKRQELEVVSAIAAAAHQNLRVDETLKTVCRQVCKQLGYQYARVSVEASQDGVSVTHAEAHGSVIPGASIKTVKLAMPTGDIGELSVARHGPISEDELRFLQDVANAVALAVNNAIAFAVIGGYRRELEDRVTERTAQLQSALEQVKLQQVARQRIFQNISHELRTPLSLIGLSTGDIMYRDGETLSSKSKERLDQIEDSIQRLLHLFDGMLLLAAGQEGKLRIRPKPADLAINLRSLVSAWQVSAEKHSIDLHYAGPDRLSMRLDEAGVDRLVQNLLSNAIKFTPQGGSIEVRLEALPGEKVQIAVQDSGVGMDTEFLGRVFGRFEQGPAPVRTGERGSGIGLAIVKEIAEAHGGGARVESERGRGSTFFITLPKEQDMARISAMGDGSYVPEMQTRAPERETAEVKPTSDVLPSNKAATVTVLVAEDDPTLRQFLVELLSRDYRVVAASDGLAALRLAKEHQPAILISDIQMPGIDGIELTKRFRAQSADKLAPVILLTAYALVETRLQGLEAGAIDYVTKPFHPEELLARVRGQLALRDLAARLHETQRLAGLGILSAGLAHELRNPANGVVNAIAPLKKMLPPEVLKPGTSTALLFDAMSAGAEQIAVLTKQLLGFSRQGELEVREESMSRILDSAEALVEPALGGRRVRRDLQPIEKVRCARGLVVQILVNLLENAAHASPPGAEILLSTRLEKDLVMFEVKDSGAGVPKEMRARIFDPFFTTKAPGQGTGLGLTISKMIAERHGGNLRLLESDKGALFRLELPAERVELPKTSPVLEGTALGGHP